MCGIPQLALETLAFPSERNSHYMTQEPTDGSIMKIASPDMLWAETASAQVFLRGSQCVAELLDPAYPRCGAVTFASVEKGPSGALKPELGRRSGSSLAQYMLTWALWERGAEAVEAAGLSSC